MNLEVPDDVYAGYQRWVAELQAADPDSTVTLQDLLREAAAKALADHLADAPPKKRR